jgi:hypothetical protein
VTGQITMSHQGHQLWVIESTCSGLQECRISEHRGCALCWNISDPIIATTILTFKRRDI